MTNGGTSEVEVDRKSVVFKIKLHLVKGIAGKNSKDSGGVRFGGIRSCGSFLWRCSCCGR